MGLCNVKETTGESLSKTILEFLEQLDLDPSKIRSQTYDGAGNMAGVHKGCQALIKSKYPLASFYHCGAHINHLVVSKSIAQSRLMKDALEQVQELGNLYTRSGKFKTLYFAAGKEDQNKPTSLKPICPTRWLTRVPAVEALLLNYIEQY